MASVDDRNRRTAFVEPAANEYYTIIVNGIRNRDAVIISILISIFVIVFTTLLFCLLRGRKNIRRGLLLLGLCDSGKTLLLSRLVHKRYVATHTSIKENSGMYQSLNGKSLRIIDLPGHERLRTQFWDNYKNYARGIIFMIDSVTFQKDLKDVAELLYSLLTDKVVSQNYPPILIACNKQDMTLAKSAKVIQSQLEKEINTVRMTRSAALDSTQTTSNNNTFLGKRNKDFEFNHLSPLKIEFAECSAKMSKGDENDTELNQIDVWLSKIA